MTSEYLTKKLSSKADVKVQSKRVDLNKIQLNIEDKSVPLV